MLRHRLYYSLKPYLPRRFRDSLRRIYARRTRAASTSIWPINPDAAGVPDGWSGWPGGKKFALVLTHDVEGMAGLAKCRELAELEMTLGFRSSFNFIPECGYSTSPEFRTWLIDRGFEVGVHDLKHDGRLFWSRRSFGQKAARINNYIREWGAAGFRSGFMLRNLDWIHELDIQYDTSTFDTDPFELQSDGANTIFPFWIPTPEIPSVSGNAFSEPYLATACSDRGGYLELPYTLPQDSTLFLVLGETSPAIWVKKLDWIAEHGGMALLNVHPDYINFSGTKLSDREYPVAMYTEFLKYLSSRYSGNFWNPQPKNLAQWFKSVLRKKDSSNNLDIDIGIHRANPTGLTKHPLATLPREPAKTGAKRICMVTYSFYESDNRVTRYAEALAARGDYVQVFALRRSTDSPVEEYINGVHVLRLQDRFGKTEKSTLSYVWPLLRFLSSASLKVTRHHIRQPYDLVHVHNMPDFLVFAAWYPKLTGVKIILDIHDIVPEFYESKFGSRKSRNATSILRFIERRSAHFANHVIVSNHLWLDKFSTRTGTQSKCTVFINNVDTRTFQPKRRIRNDDKTIILFPGGLQWHQGLDIALRAFKRVHAELPKTEFHIYGDGNVKESLVTLTSELGLDECVRFFKPVRINEISRVMAEADLGVVPKRADSFGNEAYSTKIMEFMSLGVPVVASRTKIDQYYFSDSVLRFFESGNADALVEAMLDVLKDAELRARMIARASEYAAQNSWDSRKAEYLNLVDSLPSRRSAHIDAH
jgi:glycosyltransferase involved in cell wall biosynthesis